MTQSPARTTGEYGPTGLLMEGSFPMGRRRCYGLLCASGSRTVSAASGRPPARMTLVTPRRGGDRGEHRIRAVDRFGVVVLDHDVDRRRVDGTQDAERSNGQVVDGAVLVDGDAFVAYPSEGHVGGTDAVGSQHHLVERFAAAHAHRHVPVRDRRTGNGTVGAA